MLREPWRVASARARMSARACLGRQARLRWGRGRGVEVAVTAMRRLARDAERLGDRGECLALAQRAGDVDALERVEFAAQCGQRAQRDGGLGRRQRTLEQGEDPLRVGGHCSEQRTIRAKVG